jgi:hypothetical protein
MGVAQVVANDVLSSPPPSGQTALKYHQSDSRHESFFPSSNDLRNVIVSDVAVRLVDQVEHCPQVGALRAEINLDAHRVIDPDFILHEKKEIF